MNGLLTQRTEISVMARRTNNGPIEISLQARPESGGVIELSVNEAGAGFLIAGIQRCLKEGGSKETASEGDNPEKVRMQRALEACEAYLLSPGMTAMNENDVEYTLLQEVREALGKFEE